MVSSMCWTTKITLNNKCVFFVCNKMKGKKNNTLSEQFQILI